MATATATATVDLTRRPDVSQRYFGVFFTLAVTANPDTYATGGLTLSFAVKNNPANRPPVLCWVWSEDPANGYIFGYQTGTTIANGKLFIMASLTVVTGTGPVCVQMTNGTAIPAAISGDTKLRAFAMFQSA